MEGFQNVRVLVTGGNGFIGSHLTSSLVDLNSEVYIITRSNDTKNISEILDKIKFFKADLTDYQKLNKTIKDIQPEVIFHLASDVNASRDISLLHQSIDNNLNGTINLLNSLNSINYKVFVNVGTCEEYGNAKTPFTEDISPIPVSPYSTSKVATTYYCKMLHETQKFPIVMLRPFLTYGPRQVNKMFIPSLIINALQNKDFRMTKGEQTREFNYVDDIVDGMLKSALSKKAIGEIINIGNGKEYRIINVAKKILEVIDSKSKLDTSLPYRPGETMHFYCSNKKAKDLLDWKPSTSLEEGLKKTIEWYSYVFKTGEIKKWIV